MHAHAIMVPRAASKVQEALTLYPRLAKLLVMSCEPFMYSPCIAMQNM